MVDRLQNTGQNQLFGENLITSYGPYEHFGQDGLEKDNGKSWVTEENVGKWGPAENDRKI